MDIPSHAESVSSSLPSGTSAPVLRSSEYRNAATAELTETLADAETRRRVVCCLRRELEEADCFWAKLEDNASETCGDDIAESVVAAFKSIHTRRVSGMNLEQIDAVCRDVLALVAKRAARDEAP
ncbi:hypothetical protein BESB_027720 [Besnoitia besnoiti]|uniref:Uncharacterized protein n=1 Tax=Besnoitia besnoiti TaxID=94643 RepID=A0A2A9M6T5_BESBE|nr:uncharacterized protein BESB_027720 [Besnoitia besnoiti]PFH31337.1 hypothetical protein BESB_027720 [Besnoitia besnoiti]